MSCIEGIPVIIRFKTFAFASFLKKWVCGIEGIPVIIRFKTLLTHNLFLPIP